MIPPVSKFLKARGKDEKRPAHETTREQNKRPPRNNCRIWTKNNLEVSPALKTDLCLIFVQHPWTPSVLKVTAVEDKGKLEKLHESLEEYCLASQCLTRIPRRGNILFVKVHDHYYRAQVWRFLHDGYDNGNRTSVVDVKLLDVGGDARVWMSNCYEADSQIMKAHPVYSIDFVCKMKFKLIPGLVLGDNLGKYLKRNFCIDSDAVWTGKLKMTGTLILSPHRTWNWMLETYLDSLANERQLEIKDEDLGDDDFDSAKTDCTKLAGPNKTAMSALNNPFSKVNFNRITIIGNNEKVKIKSFQEFNLVVVTAEKDQEKISKMESEISEFAEKAPSIRGSPQPGDFLLAPFQGLHYRSKVQSVDGQDETCYVELTDYGDRLWVKTRNLKELSDPLKSYPIFGLPIRLHGVPETVPNKRVQEYVEQLLEKYAEEEDFHFVLNKFGGVDSNGVPIGSLWIPKYKCSWNEVMEKAISVLSLLEPGVGTSDK